MRKGRSLTAGAVWALAGGLGVLAALGGCRGSVPATPLQSFLDRFEDLPPVEQEAALRPLAAGGGQEAAWAHYALGNLFYAAGSDSAAFGDRAAVAAVAHFDSARACFARAVAADSTFVEAWVNLGSVLDDLSGQRSVRDRAQQQADQHDAEQAYRRAVALRPGDEKALCNLGALYVRMRRHPEALAQFQAALAAHPKSALAHYNLAIMFAETKIYREALREWRAAAEAEPKSDIGRRSRENLKIVEQMMAAPTPASVTAPAAAGQAKDHP